MNKNWGETYQKIKEQGYVWIKTEEGEIVKDNLPKFVSTRTFWYNIALVQKDYGKTFALTKEELE